MEGLFGYNIEGRLLDVFDSLMGDKKDARILDAGAGTGLSGIEVNQPFVV